MEGKIIKNISNAYTVLCDNKEYVCTPRGVFRNKNITPLVGDICKIDEKNNIITEIMPRKNVLDRPSVSNVTYALLVTSLKKPSLSLNLLDREISFVILSNIKPVICFTKLDLLNDTEKKELNNIINYYEKIGIPVFLNTNIDALVKFLKGSIVVLTGQSGAGKSTLLNKIKPELNLKTNEISDALNRGKHTTRHTELFNTNGIWFCDTPGFSSLILNKFTKEEIKDSFIEFKNYHCMYDDCMHIKENDCSVKEALHKGDIMLSRYENYKKILEDVDGNSRFVFKK